MKHLSFGIAICITTLLMSACGGGGTSSGASTDTGKIVLSEVAVSCKVDTYVTGGFSVADLDVTGYATNNYSKSVEKITLELKLFDAANNVLLTRYFDMPLLVIPPYWVPNSINYIRYSSYNRFSVSVCANTTSHSLGVHRGYFE